MCENGISTLRSKNSRLSIEDLQISTKHNPIIGYAREPLVSLADACAPLMNMVDNLSKFVLIALRCTPDQPPDDLTQAESASIRLYTMEWNDPHKSLSSMLNQALQSNDPNQLKPWFKYLKLFLTALLKIPCIPPQIVWGVMETSITQGLLDGVRLTWCIFVSCTTKLSELESDRYLHPMGERAVFSIEIFSGRNIRSHSYFDTDDEILILPGICMQVQSRSDLPNLTIVHLKQLTGKEILFKLPFKGTCFHPREKCYWHKNKRLLLSICSLTIVFCIAIIIGSIFGIGLSTKNFSVKPTVSICSELFSSSTKLQTGSNPQFIVADDFNGDTKLDLAVVKQRDDAVSIFLGNGDGTYQNQILYQTDHRPHSLVTGDFNNDHKLDLAIDNLWNDSISILLGRGDGTFQSQTNFVAGSWPRFLITGDFNNDKILDLVVANKLDDCISVFLGYGNGTFWNRATYAINKPTFLTVNDFNNDNNLDLIIGSCNNSSISLLLGNGDATFQNRITYITGQCPIFATIDDFNSDNFQDLIVLNSDSQSVSLFFSNGNGTFQNQIMYRTGQQPTSIITGDFNNDKKQDLIVANYNDNTISILFSNGNGTFQDPIIHNEDDGPYYLVSGDFNNDNKIDLAMASSHVPYVTILFNSC